ncbi:ferredoxin reductase domain-containing protein [Actinocorallia aurea]
MLKDVAGAAPTPGAGGAGRGPARLGVGTVVVNRELVDTAASHGRSKRHLEIVLPEGTTYLPGDYLAVLPPNPADVVERALARFGLARGTRLVPRPKAGPVASEGDECADPGQQRRGGAPPFAGERLTARELLTGHVALTEPATRGGIERIAAATPAHEGGAALAALAARDPEDSARRPTLLDLVEGHPACALDFAAFLDLHAPLVPRRYSISSSPRWDPRRVSLTVAVVRDPSGAFGSASTYLGDAAPGTPMTVGVVGSGKAFHPPESLTTPLVMACAGTGVAPFRGFLQDRAVRAREEGVTPAPALLFFGCDHPDVDFLYRDELAAWSAAGIVDVRPAFSAAPEDGVRYVQDRVWRDRADVMELLRRDAVFYVCGDGRRMAPAVADACARIYADATDATPAESAEWLALRLHHGHHRTDAYL